MPNLTGHSECFAKPIHVYWPQLYLKMSIHYYERKHKLDILYVKRPYIREKENQSTRMKLKLGLLFLI
jgi:hypothetical protein